MCHVCAPVDRPLPPPVTGGLDVAAPTPKPAAGSGTADRPSEGEAPQQRPHEVPAGIPRVSVRHSLFRPGMWGQFTLQKQVMMMAAISVAAALAVFSKVKLKTAVLPVTTPPLKSGQGST